MKLLFVRGCALVAVVVALGSVSHRALCGAAAPPWPPVTDLPNDPAIVAGQLPNGLRYAVRANSEPRGRISLRLLVRAGSLDETDDERGLAHYLEHMGFNGTRHFPGETIVDYLQRQGMNFGADSNASTGFDRTQYMLELPRGDAAALAEGLKVLRDYADGMMIDEAEVAAERGIILAEKRARDSVEFRTTLAEYEFILPGTRPPQRFPIGVEETLLAATSARLRGFYERWYRPDNIAVVAVGDFDPALAVRLIEEAFASMTTGAPFPARAAIGQISPAAAPVAMVHREVEASTVSVGINVVAPWTKPPDSAAERRRDLPLNAANAILTRRLQRLAKLENAPFTAGSANAGDAFDFVTIASIDLSGPPERWRDALALAEQEIRRALEHGFAPAELKEVTASILNSLEEAVRSAPTRRSAGLASGILGAIDDERVFTTPETNLELLRPAVAQLTVADCLRALREAWSAAAPRIFVSGRVAADDTADSVLTAFRESTAVAVAPPEDIADEAFAYTDFGPPGEVVAREHVADLDLVLVRFANGVRLNLKRTDFQANDIGLVARLGGGTLELPRDRPELARIAGPLINDGGLGRHDEDSLNRLLAGRTVQLGFGVGDDAFSFSGSTSPKDLELQLQLLCAYLTDPGLRDDVLPRLRRAITQSYERMAHLPSGVAQREINPLLASGDPRFGVPPLDAVLAVTPADVRAWLAPVFAGGALEVSLIGDLDVDATIALAAKTIGALPPRTAKPDFAAARRVAFPHPAPEREFSVDTEIQKALVFVFWPTDDGRDIHRTRRLGLLASVFSDRLRKVVREELGAAYSPSAGSSASETYPGYGYMSAVIEVDPPQAGTVQQAILRLAGELQRDGVTDDELQRAKEPVLTSIRVSWRQNNYWLGSVLARAQEKPEVLDWSRSRQADFESITKADLDALAARYLDPARTARFIIRPTPAISVAASAPTATP